MIKIGAVIYNALYGNVNIKAEVGNKIFPLVAPEKTTGNFIVYKRSFTTDGNKDSVRADASIELIIITTDYETGVDLAAEAITTINSLQGSNEGYYIFSAFNTSAGESFTEDGYNQTLNFTVKASY